MLGDIEFAKSMTDFKEFCRQSYVIDKSGIPKRFILNEAQEEFARVVLKAIDNILKRKPSPSIKIVCHKSRQMGITTVCLKLEQFILSKTKNMNALHVMPDEREASNMVDRKMIPLLQGTHSELLPNISYTGDKLDFIDFAGVHLSNRLSFSSANTRSGYAGRTISLLLFDEYALYTDPFSLESNLLPALTPNSIRIVLFTAKGMNHAYDLVKTAQDPESDWIHIFLPWYMLSEYETRPKGRYKKLEGFNDYDRFLIKEFKKAKVPMERWTRKLQWYNDTFINEAKKSVQYMHEAYPTIPSESFEASGSPLFDNRKLYSWMTREFKTLDLFTSSAELAEFRYVEGGALKEYESPIPGHAYLIGVDCSDGLYNGDNSAFCVLDTTSNAIRCVASYGGGSSQEDTAELVYHAAKRYNEALVVPERNTGQLFIKMLTEAWDYWNIYSDAKLLTSTAQLGVYTTNSSKNEMMARMKFLMNHDFYEDFDPDFCNEALYFTSSMTEQGNVKMSAARGHHDDLVMSRLVAMMAIDMDRFKLYNEQRILERG
jgi:hypothetical protein